MDIQSGMTLDEIIQLKPLFGDNYDRGVRVTLEEDDATLKELCRKWNAELIKAYTGPDAELPRLWEANGLGITCVALRGIDSLCVVAKASDLVAVERNLLRFEDGEDITTFSIWNALANEIEGIEDEDHSCKRPFCVVTLALKTGLEASTANYCAENTSKFLQEEMKSDATSTCNKTIQTTISAFQHLCCREFEAHEIRAFVWKDGDILGKELQQRREKPDIDELLASIRELPNDNLDLVMAYLGRDQRSRFSKKSKATHPKEGRESQDERRQRRKKVRKLSSKRQQRRDR